MLVPGARTQPGVAAALGEAASRLQGPFPGGGDVPRGATVKIYWQRALQGEPRRRG